MSRHHVLHVSRYDFKDDSGRTVRGAKVTYLGESQNDEKSRGNPVIKINGPYELFEKFHKVPSTYEMDFAQKQSSNGQVVLSLKDAALVQ